MKPETQSFYERAVARAVEQVLQDLDRALDLAVLARSAALSPFHFHRIFRGALGETPLELHRRLRLERAAFSLRHHQETPVTAIAFSAGYETHESFTRAFRAHYDCSPSEFRQNQTAPGAPCERPRQIELPARSGIHFRPLAELSAIRFIRGEPTMNVEIKDMQALRVATVRHVGPYNRISEAFARLGSIVGPAGLLGPDTIMLAIYHDDPETTESAELRSDAGVVVPPAVELTPGLGEQRLPAGRYATTTHVGPYEQLGDVWARFMGEWLPQSGERVSDGLSYEIYRNTPGDTPKERLRTELYVPLA